MKFPASNIYVLNAYVVWEIIFALIINHIIISIFIFHISIFSKKLRNVLDKKMG